MSKTDSKKYTKLDQVLQDVTRKCITLSDDDTKIYNEQLKQVLSAILNEMKKNDAVFKALYQKETYTGSFYENLRISKPTEFDINLVMLLPATDYKIIQDGNEPGFVKIKVNKLDQAKMLKIFKDVPNGESTLGSWIDSKSHYLLRTEFIQWMHGVVQKAINTVSIENTKVKLCTSGPAVTVKVIQPQTKLEEFSVDLVPVFEFGTEDWPQSPIRQYPKEPKNVTKEWCVVPKSPNPKSKNDADQAYWRISFYKQEKDIMNDLGSMKHIIKLMKLFRDQEKWKKVSSYAIKTMFLWMHEEKKSREYWQSSIGILFIHMLKQFSQHLEKGSIPFYWDKRHDVLNNIKRSTMDNMKDRINGLIKQVDKNLENNPKYIQTYFGVTLENSHQINVTSIEYSEQTEMEEVQENLIDIDEDNQHEKKEEPKQVSSTGIDTLLLTFHEEIEKLKSEIKKLNTQQEQMHEDLKFCQKEISELREENLHLKKLIKIGVVSSSSSRNNIISKNIMDSEVPCIPEQQMNSLTNLTSLIANAPGVCNRNGNLMDLEL